MNADDWINRWKKSVHSEAPDPPADLSERVLRRLDPDRSVSLLLWICRIGLVVLAAAALAGRVMAMITIFLTSTPLQ